MREDAAPAWLRCPPRPPPLPLGRRRGGAAGAAGRPRRPQEPSPPGRGRAGLPRTAEQERPEVSQDGQGRGPAVAGEALGRSQGPGRGRAAAGRERPRGSQAHGKHTHKDTQPHGSGVHPLTKTQSPARHTWDPHRPLGSGPARLSAA